MHHSGVRLILCGFINRNWGPHSSLSSLLPTPLLSCMVLLAKRMGSPCSSCLCCSSVPHPGHALGKNCWRRNSPPYSLQFSKCDSHLHAFVSFSEFTGDWFCILFCALVITKRGGCMGLFHHSRTRTQNIFENFWNKRCCLFKLLQNNNKKHATGAAKDEKFLNACKTNNIPLRNLEEKNVLEEKHTGEKQFSTQ